MKRIVIATYEPERELINLVSFMLKGMNLKVNTSEFNNLYADNSDTDVLLCNYTLLDDTDLSFKERCSLDAAFVMDCPQKDKLISVWTGTPHLRVAKDTDSLLKLLADATCDSGLEIERKFLIEYPDIKFFESLSSHRAVNMEQVYLKRGQNGESIRIRKSWENDSYIFFKTEKAKISDMVRIEKEYEITPQQYKDCLKDADLSLKPISKTRHYLMYKDIYYEIDVFPFWKNQAYLEVELSSQNDTFDIPPFIKAIREVTGDKRYTNHALAGNVPDED